MGNIATTISQQIERLEKRGMVLDLPIEKIKEVLLDVGYYRLGFYWNPFEIDENHNFKEGTKFSTTLDLYYLDVDLRYLLIKILIGLSLVLEQKSSTMFLIQTRIVQLGLWTQKL